MSTLKLMTFVSGLLLLVSCGGGNNLGGSNADVNSGSTSGTSTTTCAGVSNGNIIINGVVNFQRVPHKSTNKGFGLDYTATFVSPARGVTVLAFDVDTDTMVATGTTDSTGHYSLSVPNNTNIKIRVVAQMVRTGNPPNWNFSVKDNSNGNAGYAMDGNSNCTRTGNETRNLTALSGWTGSSYSNPRTAAPFAILDTVYDGMQLVLNANATLNFPALTLFWSPANSDSTIGTSYFDGSNGIYLLGDQNVDTDEYDPSVIAHEWGHYIEEHFSRSDSIGGFHSTGDFLDMRLAFGEGFGNAFSSMVRNDPVYADASGNQQSTGFGFNVESESVANPGWYSESSVEKILYDLFDSTNDNTDADTLSLGFRPIWDVLINEERSEPVFTGIFKFINALKVRNPGEAAAIDVLVNAQNIHVADPFGGGEINDAGHADVIPIYDAVTTTTPATNVCVTNAFRRNLTGISDYNVLGMNHYIRFTPQTTGSYKFTISSGSSSGDPDAVFYNGASAHSYQSSVAGSETFVENLSTVSEYMLEFDDYQILSDTNTLATRCYTVTVAKQ